MTEMVFIKGECGTLDIKEEYVEEEDPLRITKKSYTVYSIQYTVYSIQYTP